MHANVDHKFFINKLTVVKDIHNDLMYYSPDPTPDGIYDEVEGLLEFSE